jgi:hypothetical protein
MIALAGIGDGVQTNWHNNGRHGSKGTSGSGDGFGGVL